LLRTTNTVFLVLKHKHKIVRGIGGMAPHLILDVRGQLLFSLKFLVLHLAEKGIAAPYGEEAVWRRELSWKEETTLCVC
jgi:hypothetical protein